jgi:hypothetical protein
VIKSSNVCLQGTWDLGDAILGVCQSVLRCSDTESVRQPLGDALLYIWRHYGDVDIRDQARFTYMLLTNVSGAYLRTVLEQKEVASLNRTAAADSYKEFLVLDTDTDADAQSRRENIADAQHKLVSISKLGGVPNEAGDGDEHAGGLAQTGTDSSVLLQGSASAINGSVGDHVAETAAASSGTSASLSRRGSSSGLTSRAAQALPLMMDQGVLSRLKSDPGVLDEYASHLLSRSDQVRVRLACLVSYEVAAGLARLIKPPTRLFAVKLSFSTDADYLPIEDVHVPRLCRPAHEEGDGEGGARNLRTMSTSDSPLRGSMQDEHSHAIVTIVCRPRVPVPAALAVRVEYTDNTGGSFWTQAEVLSVDFVDLFCDVSLPVSWPTSGPTAAAYRVALFDQLWKAIEDRAAQDAEVRSGVCVCGVFRQAGSVSMPFLPSLSLSLLLTLLYFFVR